MFSNKTTVQSSNLFANTTTNSSQQNNNDNKSNLFNSNKQFGVGTGGQSNSSLFNKTGSDGLFSNTSSNQSTAASFSNQSNGSLFSKGSTTGGLFQQLNKQSSQTSSNLFKSSGSPSFTAAGSKSSPFGSGSSNSQLFSSKSVGDSKSSLFSNNTTATTGSLFDNKFNSSQDQASKKSIFATSGQNTTSSGLFAQQSSKQQQKQVSDIFDIKKVDQVPIEHNLFPQAQYSKKQGHIFPEMKQVEVKQAREVKQKILKPSRNQSQMALFTPSKQQINREQKRVRFKIEEPQNDESLAKSSASKTIQDNKKNTKSMVQLKFKVINAIQNKLAQQISNGKMTLQKAQQYQSQYQNQVFNNNNIPQQLLNLVQSTQPQSTSTENDAFSTISLGEFIKTLYNRWQETKAKYENVAQHIRHTEQKYFDLKKVSDIIDQMTQSYTMRNFQEQRKLEQLDIRANNLLSKFQTILGQLVATNLINLEQVEEIKKVCECDVNESSDMTLVDFVQDVRDQVLQSGNDNKENLMDKFRGMSCLLLGARHMKDIVKKLYRVLGRIQPSNNKKLLKMVFKGRNKKSVKRKSYLRRSALHNKIKSFFRQIVKLEHNAVSFNVIYQFCQALLSSQLDDYKLESQRLLNDGSQIQEQLSALMIN